jgi:hypothetical protein
MLPSPTSAVISYAPIRSPDCQSHGRHYHPILTATRCYSDIVKTIATTIEEETLDRVAAGTRPTAASNRSKVIRTAVRDYLARLERAAEEEREREILKRHARRLARQAAALVKEQAKS